MDSQRLGGALKLRSLNHISRVCHSVEESKRFYEEVLGFVPITRPSSFDFEGCWLFQYNLGIHLIQGTPPPRQHEINPKADHLSFQSDSLQEVEATLRRLDIPFERTSVEEGGITVQQIFFHDPDDNMIEVCNCDCLPIKPIDPHVTSVQQQPAKQPYTFGSCTVSLSVGPSKKMLVPEHQAPGVEAMQLQSPC